MRKQEFWCALERSKFRIQRPRMLHGFLSIHRSPIRDRC